MSKSRYDKIRKEIELNLEIEALIRERNVPADKINEWRRKYIGEIRRELARIDREFPDPLEKPMTEGWRSLMDDECGEEGYDFRILPVKNPDDWEDEEIEEYILNKVGYPPINSPYDCTGKRFTMWVNWKRQPAGIVMIHRWGLDV